ncbi:S-layer homology domain-containing protein [Alteribacillus sp. JSM 102045]|uniref:S-layer homology domain-containing protein n=1 Tax=Alteribacillus sp. JSM 102045 TaxID=1562101 RepID=UPI0035BF32B9
MLVATGITTGTSDTEFDPNELINRGQMAAFINRTLQYVEDTTDELRIEDVKNSISFFHATRG